MSSTLELNNNVKYYYIKYNLNRSFFGSALSKFILNIIPLIYHTEIYHLSTVYFKQKVFIYVFDQKLRSFIRSITLNELATLNQSYVLKLNLILLCFVWIFAFEFLRNQNFWNFRWLKIILVEDSLFYLNFIFVQNILELIPWRKRN